MTDAESTVYNEDCLVGLKRFSDNHFDLAIVDPPYGINAPNMQMWQNLNRNDGWKRTESTAVKMKKGRLNSGGGHMKNSALVNMHSDWDFQKPTADYFKELFRVSKNQVIWGGNYFDLPPTRCIICWDKVQPWENFSQWEMAWTSFDKPAKMYRISKTGGSHDHNKIHPTQKPVPLYDRIYRDFAEAGMKVLDTHLGSGSNRISAFKHKVDFTAFEIDPGYYFSQDYRFKKFIKQKLLF